jgi:formylglycine-generating enzyme required for sulfatase activity
MLKAMKRIPLLLCLSALSLSLDSCVNTPALRPQASKASPFINSLGMKFVPVPGTRILMCTTETTVAQYQAMGQHYQQPEFPQESNHPAESVSWNQSKEWCNRLSKREGLKYRLPTSDEWTAAVGRSSTYPWGNQWPPPNDFGNYMGEGHKESYSSHAYFRSLKNKSGFWTIIPGYTDHHVFTAPVGSYPANKFGIYDLGGNVWEWCEDLWDADHDWRVLRGASWLNHYDDRLKTAYRLNGTPDGKNVSLGGFRCVIELEAVSR